MAPLGLARAAELDEGGYMDKLQPLWLTGRNLTRVFNFRGGCVHAMPLYFFETKLLNLKLKTRPKQLLVSLPFDTVLPGGYTLTMTNTEFCARLDTLIL